MVLLRSHDTHSILRILTRHTLRIWMGARICNYGSRGNRRCITLAGRYWHISLSRAKGNACAVPGSGRNWTQLRGYWTLYEHARYFGNIPHFICLYHVFCQKGSQTEHTFFETLSLMHKDSAEPLRILIFRH